MEIFPTWVLLEEVTFVIWKQREHPLSNLVFDHILPFAVPPIVLINIEEGVMVMNKPCNHRWPLVDLQGVWKPLDCIHCGHQVAAALVFHGRTTVPPQYP